jgi:hypothetical protein
MASHDLTREASLVTRLLFEVRWLLGRWFGWDDGAERPIPGHDEITLAERLPDDLRGTAAGLALGSRFAPLYRTDTEFAAEISNQTVHGVMHLAWVDRGEGRYQGQMAVYVKPRGRLGKQYMAFIAPFRHWVVYPAHQDQKDVKRELVAPSAFGQPGQGGEYRRGKSEQQGRAGNRALQESGPDPCDAEVVGDHDRHQQ